MAKKIEVASNVIPLPKRDPVAKKMSERKEKKESERKWGTQVIALGYSILPSLLFKAQRRLGLSRSELAVIVHLADFWWKKGNLPWPSKEMLAERLGVTEKQIQRIIRGLEKRGYVARGVRMTPHGQTSNSYDLSGLVKKLKQLAPEFAEAAKAKRKVERRGGLKSA